MTHYLVTRQYIVDSKNPEDAAEDAADHDWEESWTVNVELFDEADELPVWGQV